MEKEKAIQLKLLTKQTDILAAELAQLKDRPVRRAEIIAQIIRLGMLYKSIRTGNDPSLHDR